MLDAAKDSGTRWAVSNGPLAVATSGPSATAVCGSVSVEAEVSDGKAVITVEAALKLMPEVGQYEITWECGVETFVTFVERVGSRYCSPADVIDYGKPTNDGFDDEARYPRALIDFSIQQAEEAIEVGRRSFCRRGIDVRIAKGFNELPVQDAVSITLGELVSDRQAVSDSPGLAKVVYGARPDARIREAAVRLAASFIRPRLKPENARGESVDGVYTSFTLATGAEGSWTGIPYVDAVIEEHRSHRVVVS